MFIYPKQAEFNRVVPKGKIYEHAKASKRLKQLLVDQVEEIIWKYKLSPETINLPASGSINEIQVFEIRLRTREFEPDLLQAIDKAIPFPLAFQLIDESKACSAVAYKRPSEADSSKWVTEGLFVTPFYSTPFKEQPLPVALNLAILYEHMVRAHIPLAARSGEGLAEQVVRFNELEAKKRAKEQLEFRLSQEKQFNRKVELNAELRKITEDLLSLAQLKK
jgi:hypothetical protein